MSSADIAFAFEDMLRVTAHARPAVLRLALRSGEALKIPAVGRHVNVLAGTAWISQAGKDIVVPARRCLQVEGSKDAAVVSPVGREGLLIEVL